MKENLGANDMSLSIKELTKILMLQICYISVTNNNNCNKSGKMKVRYFPVTHLPHNQNSSIL